MGGNKSGKWMARRVKEKKKNRAFIPKIRNEGVDLNSSPPTLLKYSIPIIVLYIR